MAHVSAAATRAHEFHLLQSAAQVSTPSCPQTVQGRVAAAGHGAGSSVSPSQSSSIPLQVSVMPGPMAAFESSQSNGTPSPQCLPAAPSSSASSGSPPHERDSQVPSAVQTSVPSAP
jgi:hypothetical protein